MIARSASTTFLQRYSRWNAVVSRPPISRSMRAMSFAHQHRVLVDREFGVGVIELRAIHEVPELVIGRFGRRRGQKDLGVRPVRRERHDDGSVQVVEPRNEARFVEDDEINRSCRADRSACDRGRYELHDSAVWENVPALLLNVLRREFRRAALEHGFERRLDEFAKIGFEGSADADARLRLLQRQRDCLRHAEEGLSPLAADIEDDDAPGEFR
jgi:hypothetical protein